MLNEDGLRQWAQRLRLPENAVGLVRIVRSSEPSRHVQSRARNVSGRYPSRKMGVTIQFESHRGELAAIYEMEHDPDVFEFYDQPPSIKLNYQHTNGRSLGVMHTPDFFVLSVDEAGWLECKTEEELLKLAQKSPYRYVQTPDGKWDCPPGREYAAQFGLFYRIRSSSMIHWIFQRNVLFLEDYWRAPRDSSPNEWREDILATVEAQPGISLSDLLAHAGGNSDDVYALIAGDHIYIDLRAAPLAEPGQVHVFRDRDIADAFTSMTASASSIDMGRTHSIEVAPGTPITWDDNPWTILNSGITATTLLGDDGRTIDVPNATFEALVQQGTITGTFQSTVGSTNPGARDLLVKASPEDLKTANRRYEILAPLLAGAVLTTSKAPARTIRRWLAKYRAAEKKYGTGFVGLLPRASDRGNRGRKLPESTLVTMQNAIENDYETLTQKGVLAAYGALTIACEQQGTVIPSYKTFAKEVRARPQHIQVLKRQGPRAAYRHESFYWELSSTTPRHGDRPFEIGHIDHTELDIELVSSQTGQNLGRPWLTMMMDAFSRRIVALYITFDPPSYRSCMMVVRECVRRHGRLPQTVVVDGGKEFSGTYFESLLARYEITKKTRPGAKARFGSVCERLFGTANTQFIHNLTGNTQIMRNVRQVTKAVNPKEHAYWTLADLVESLQVWAYDVYDSTQHSALGESPRDAYQSGLIRTGGRTHRLIAYDDNFRMATLPTTTKGTAKVQPGNGIKINSVYYWAEAFRNPEVQKSQVPVRYDPYDVATAYAYVGGRWVRCDSEHAPRLRGHSERELKLATEELRQQNRNHARKLPITAKRLAEFLNSAEAGPALHDQRTYDTETRRMFTLIDGGRASDTADGDSSIVTVGFGDQRSIDHDGDRSATPTDLRDYRNDGRRGSHTDSEIDVSTLKIYEEYS